MIEEGKGRAEEMECKIQERGRGQIAMKDAAMGSVSFNIAAT